ncbi:hypothetical protein [Streptomyces sp. NPDC050485]|uniref:hypothetical protein n=1 Tax=Streptomyces sp. NPDC050485 TaxID=3365617 RepID=UPI0037A1F32B
MVEDLVLALHAEAMNATNYVLGSGVTWREIGRALALVDDAGILLRQAAALLLGLPAADRAAEQAMVDQALAEYEEQEDDGVGEWLAESGDREADIWAAAVDQFRRGTQPGSVATG